jgi:quinolinate synthase
MHPECGCLTKSMPLADQILSTEGIVRYVERSPADEFIIGTEVGIINRLEQAAPGKRYYPAGPQAVCEHMKRNTLEKVVASLERLETVVRVPEAIARRARVPLERMLAIT